MQELLSIDLFCGAGGLTLGLERAGFRTVFAVDNDRDACSTYRAAFPHVELADRSVAEIDFSRYKGVDLIAGGPPCQPFSNGGKRRAADDDRDMIPQFVRAINEVRPRAFLMENVAGLVAPRNETYFRSVLSMFDDDYTILGPRLVNAADYGVPQKRRRVILMGFLERPIEFPKPTHGAGRRQRHIPAGSVLGTEALGPPNPSKIVYAKTPDLRVSPFAGQLFNGGGRPIDPKAPAPTILASAGGNKTHFLDTLSLVPVYHKHLRNGGRPRIGTLEGGRRITVKESALLQSFPEDMEFHGSRSAQYSQVGNAVPPTLAAVLGTALASSLTEAASLELFH